MFHTEGQGEPQRKNPIPADFPALTPAWTKWFPKDPPVRAVLIVSDFGLPGMLVEVVATAIA